MSTPVAVPERTQVIPSDERIYTADDLWELAHDPAYADARLELDRGRLIVMPPASDYHGEVGAEAITFLGPFIREGKLGRKYTSETGFILGKTDDGDDIVRAPDFAFVAAARAAAMQRRDRFVFGAPDLAVEVVSPNDSADEVQTKVAQYLEYGVQQVWVLYPRSKTLVLHTSGGARTLRQDDTLDGGTLLPGFAVRVGDFFPE